MSSLPESESGVFISAHKGSRERALAHLHALDSYRLSDNTNNFESWLSQLEVSLSHRVILETEVMEASIYDIPERFAFQIRFSIALRTLAHGWSDENPHIWDQFESSLSPSKTILNGSSRSKTFPPDTHKGFLDLYERSVETGLLSVYERIIFASIWLHELHLSWESGLSHFSYYLLDTDSALHLFLWQWVAGLIEGQVGAVVVENHAQLEGFLELKELDIYEVESELSKISSQNRYGPLKRFNPDSFNANLSLHPSGLLIFGEDLLPEVGKLSSCAYSSICILEASQSARFGVPQSEKVHFQRLSHLEDAANRISTEWLCDITAVGEEGIIKKAHRAHADNVGLQLNRRLYFGVVDDIVTSICNWATTENLRSICFYRPVQWPFVELCFYVREQLSSMGIQLIEVQREWDLSHWPELDKSLKALLR